MTIDLSALTVPGPTITALTEPFWTAVAEGRLLIQRCGTCRQAVFYPRARCPYCWSDALIWEEVSGKARLKSYSEVWKPGHAAWIEAAPYLVGLVELVEGPTMTSHILAQDNRVKVGDPLRFAPTKIGGRVLPCFSLEKC